MFCFQACNCTYGAVLKPWLSSFSDLVAKIDFNSSHVDEYQVSYFPYPIWRDESMHDLIVRVALSAADAVAQSGRSMRMGQHVMLRVDIALTRQGSMVRSFCAVFLCHCTTSVLDYTALKGVRVVGPRRAASMPIKIMI